MPCLLCAQRGAAGSARLDSGGWIVRHLALLHTGQPRGERGHGGTEGGLAASRLLQVAGMAEGNGSATEQAQHDAISLHL